MKAARVTKFNEPYEIQEIPIPKCKPNRLLVKTAAAGYCHTDGMVRDGEFQWAGSKCPVTGSHEAVGTVHEIGSEVSGFQKGDRVGALNFMGACGQCPDCRAGRPIFCDRLEGMNGINRDGGFAEYIIVDPAFTVKLPDSYEFVQAAPMMCAGLTIYKAIKVSGCRKGDILGILGLGALGHLGVQFANVMGIRVVALDTRAEPLSLKLKHPADLTLDASLGAEQIVKKIAQQCGKTREGYEGCDAVIVATGAVQAFRLGADILHKHGILVAVGQPPGPIPFGYQDFVFKDIVIKGSILGEPDALKEMIDVAAKHDIRSTVRAYKLDDINQIVADSHDEKMKGKLVVEF